MNGTSGLEESQQQRLDPVPPLSSGQTCCLIDSGIRCKRLAGNASYSKRVQRTVHQKKLKLSVDPEVSCRLLDALLLLWVMTFTHSGFSFFSEVFLEGFAFIESSVFSSIHEICLLLSCVMAFFLSLRLRKLSWDQLHLLPTNEDVTTSSLVGR